MTQKKRAEYDQKLEQERIASQNKRARENTSTRTTPNTSSGGVGRDGQTSGDQQRRQSSGPFNFNVEDLFRGYEDIFGFGRQSRDQSHEQSSQRSSEKTESERQQREAADQKRRETRARQDAEAEAQRRERAEAERRKFQEKGREQGRDYASVLYRGYVRDETAKVLDFMVECHSSRVGFNQREAREELLRQIDNERDVFNQYYQNRLRDQMWVESHGMMSSEQLRGRIDMAIGLLHRLRVARSIVRGDLKPGDMQSSGTNIDTREAFETEFTKSWDEVAKAGGTVDKHKYWFVPLTKEEVVVEETKAREWIKTEGRERGKLIKRLMESPQAAEDERFARIAIRKSEGLLGSIATPEERIGQQYEWMMQEVGTINESNSGMWRVKEEFYKRFKKDKANRGKDVDAEWEVTLFRYRAEAEAMRIKNNMEKYRTMPQMDFPNQRSLRTKYDVEDFLVGMPRAAESEKLYNEGLKEGFFG